MLVKLANGSELEPIVVTGGTRYVQGVSRDALNFVFPAEASLDELDEIFTPENCEKITIVDDEGNEYIHNAYTVRAELKREPMEVEPATESTEAVVENRVTVTMAQRTYQESQMANMEAALAALAGKEV